MSDIKTFARADVANFKNIPDELKAIEQWECWKVVDGRKLPIDAHTAQAYPPGKYTSETMATATFAEAVSCFVKHDDLIGIGFRFKKNDPYCGVDLDKCRNPETGVFEDWAQKLIKQFPTYAEISPSGTGVKFFTRGSIPSPVVQTNNTEMYDCNRFFAMTGLSLNGNAVADCQTQLSKLHKRLKRTEEQAAKSKKGIPRGAHDNELTSIAGKLRRSGLEEGEIYAALVVVCEKRCDDYGTDYKKMCAKIARSVSRYEVAAEDEMPGRILITEGSNADRLKARFSQEIRYASDRKIWCTWTGTHWEVNDVLGMSRRMQEVARGIYSEAASVASESLRKALGAWALKSESSYIQRGSIEEARNMVEVKEFYKLFDTHPLLLNVSNGTIDLETMKFRPHSREDFITKIIDIKYYPDKKCPKFEKFLNETFSNKEALIKYVKRLMGYWLTALTGEQKWWCLHGPTQGGKGTFIRVMTGILGPYAYALPENYFLLSKNTTDFATGNLVGVRFAFCSESAQGRSLDVARIKLLTGEDPMSAQLKHQNFFKFTPQCKLALVTNYPPHVPAGDDALWRRLKVVPFTNTVADDKRVNNLSEILLEEESSGILNLAINGFADWKTNTLAQPVEISDATTQYRTSEDIVNDFIKECFEFDLSQDDWRLARRDTYSEYVKWSKESNLRQMSKRKFALELQRIGITGDDGDRYWKGLRIRI